MLKSGKLEFTPSGRVGVAHAGEKEGRNPGTRLGSKIPFRFAAVRRLGDYTSFLLIDETDHSVKFEQAGG